MKSSISGQRDPAGPAMTSSSIFTIQVNVDSAGQNILGDAGNEPNITMNPVNPGQMVIGWRQFDNVISNFRQAGWSHTSDGGQTWTPGGVIEPGIFRSDPVLDYDDAGNFYYNSLTIDSFGAYLCKVFESSNGGLSWNIGTDARGGDKQWMAIDRTGGVGNGNIYSSWTPNFSSCGWSFTRSTDGNSSYESCTFVDGEPYWLTMAVGIAGELFIAGGSIDVYNMVVAKSINAQVPGSIINWTSAPVFLDGSLVYGPNVNPGGFMGQVNIDLDRSAGPGQGNVYVLAAVSRISNLDPGDIMFAKSTDGGITWYPPVRVNDDASDLNTQWFGTMSVAPNGRIDAVWLDTRDGTPGSDSSALYYSFSIDHGDTWSVNEKMSDTFDPHIGYPNQFKIGDYFDMMSMNPEVHLAWANTLNGEQDVYYSHIIPQTGTGVQVSNSNAPLTVYPNPTDGIFKITHAEAGGQIEIYNVIGEIIYSSMLRDSNANIDFTTQRAGVYFLKILNKDGNVEVLKLIRE